MSKGTVEEIRALATLVAIESDSREIRASALKILRLIADEAGQVDPDAEVAAWVKDMEYISAIKEYRERTGARLREAKEAIDRLISKGLLVKRMGGTWSR